MAHRCSARSIGGPTGASRAGGSASGTLGGDAVGGVVGKQIDSHKKN